MLLLFFPRLHPLRLARCCRPSDQNKETMNKQRQRKRNVWRIDLAHDLIRKPSVCRIDTAHETYYLARKFNDRRFVV